MKKLYRKGQVHPSPAPSAAPASAPSADQFCLAYLPASILTLAAALSSRDKEVLAYLLSCSSTTPFDIDNHPCKSSPKKQQSVNLQQHAPSSSCYCFSCYTSFWARWDSSPNRQLIHEIIDAFEDNLMSQRKKKQGLSRREKRKKNNNKGSFLDTNHNIKVDVNHEVGVNHAPHGSDGSLRVGSELDRVDSAEEQGDEQLVCDETGEGKQGSVRKIVSFIGERIWGSVWG